MEIERSLRSEPILSSELLFELKKDIENSDPRGVNLERIKHHLVEIPCTICDKKEYKVRFPQAIDLKNVNFSARRPSSLNHFQMVNCNYCGLTFSNPIFPGVVYESLYKISEFIEDKQVNLMALDYLDQLKKVEKYASKKGTFLEVACADGSFLKLAQEQGYEEVWGVDSSVDAKAYAPKAVQEKIITAPFTAQLFDKEYFDIVSMNQALDHFLNPSETMKEIKTILKKGGIVMCVNHNVDFFINRILGERAPVYDIEHIYLFNLNTIRKLWEKNGFEVLYVKNIPSRYKLTHLVNMFPFPKLIRKALLWALKQVHMDQFVVKLYGGNMVSVARKL